MLHATIRALFYCELAKASAIVKTKAEIAHRARFLKEKLDSDFLALPALYKCGEIYLVLQ